MEVLEKLSQIKTAGFQDGCIRRREVFRRLNKQQGSKMDVTGKKEQRKETELDESWLKFTTKVTPNTGVDCKGAALCCCLRC